MIAEYLRQREVTCIHFQLETTIKHSSIQLFSYPAKAKYSRLRSDASRYHVMRLKSLLTQQEDLSAIFLGWTADCQLMVSYRSHPASNKALIRFDKFQPNRFIQYMQLPLNDLLDHMEEDEAVTNVHLTAESNQFVVSSYKLMTDSVVANFFDDVLQWTRSTDVLQRTCSVASNCSYLILGSYHLNPPLSRLPVRYMYDFNGRNCDRVCGRLNESIVTLPPSHGHGYLVNPSVEALIVIMADWSEQCSLSGQQTSESAILAAATVDPFDDVGEFTDQLSDTRCCKSNRFWYSSQPAIDDKPSMLASATPTMNFVPEVLFRWRNNGEALLAGDRGRVLPDWLHQQRYLSVTQSELRIEEIVDYYGRNLCFGYGYKYIGIDNYLVDSIAFLPSDPIVECVLVATVEVEKKSANQPTTWKVSAFVIDIRWNYRKCQLVSHQLFRPQYIDVRFMQPDSAGKRRRLQDWWDEMKRSDTVWGRLQRVARLPGHNTLTTVPIYQGRSLATLSAAFGGIVFVP